MFYLNISFTETNNALNQYQLITKIIICVFLHICKLKFYSSFHSSEAVVGLNSPPLDVNNCSILISTSLSWIILGKFDSISNIDLHSSLLNKTCRFKMLVWCKCKDFESEEFYFRRFGTLP